MSRLIPRPADASDAELAEVIRRLPPPMAAAAVAAGLLGTAVPPPATYADLPEASGSQDTAAQSESSEDRYAQPVADTGLEQSEIWPSAPADEAAHDAPWAPVEQTVHPPTRWYYSDPPAYEAAELEPTSHEVAPWPPLEPIWPPAAGGAAFEPSRPDVASGAPFEPLRPEATRWQPIEQTLPSALPKTPFEDMRDHAARWAPLEHGPRHAMAPSSARARWVSPVDVRHAPSTPAASPPAHTARDASIGATGASSASVGTSSSQSAVSGSPAALAASGIAAAAIGRDLHTLPQQANPSQYAQPAAEAQSVAPDLDRLAEQVFGKLRWRIAIERERLMG